MSPDPPFTHQTLAVAIVIESSLSIAQDWPKPLFQYLTYLIRRISDGHAPAKLRMGFVGYGTADTLPSPILCKRFFIDNSMVFRELFEEPLHFGIGMTNSGGSRGMAVLEGLVAALELFDGLQLLPNTKINGSYIIHIAASPADNSRNPDYNDSVLMDDVNWASLPDEFKKRNISYNILSTKPPQAPITDLYAALNGTATPSTPWFEMRSTHKLFAAPIVALKVAQHKRQGEVQNNDRTPENKRPRLQTAAEFPKPTPKPAPARPPSQPQLSPPSQGLLHPPIQPQPPQIQPQPPATTVPQVQASLPTQEPIQQQTRPQQTVTVHEALQRYTEATASIDALLKAYNLAKTQGNTARAAVLERELLSRRQMHEKMKRGLEYFQKMQAAAQAQMAVQQSQASVPTGNLSAGTALPAGSSALDVLPATQFQHARSMSGSVPLPLTMSTSNSGAPTVPGPSNMDLQMQKLIEQKQRSHAPIGNLHVGAGMPSQTPVPHTGPPGSSPFAAGSDFSAGSDMVGANPLPVQPSPRVEWSGILKWSGQSPGGKKEMQCAVSLSSAMNPEKARTDTWPSVMMLIPAPEQFPIADMHEWIKRHQPCLCLFKPPLDEEDQSNYRQLITLLVGKSRYATAAWTTPSGNQTRNAIFFPHMQQGILAGAVFPVTGLPELPKSGSTNAAIPQGMMLPAGMSMNQNMAAFIKSLSPEQRQLFLTQWAQSRMQQPQAQLPNQDGPSVPPFNPPMQPGPSYSSMTAPLNMMGVPQAPSNPMMGMHPQAGMPAPLGGRPPVNSANSVPSNVSYEMLQSFMQRNASDGSMGPKT